MLFSLGEMAVVFVLAFIAFAGFMIYMPVAIIHDINGANSAWQIAGLILGGCTISALPQLAVIGFARKVWGEPQTWRLFGFRRRLWQFFIPVAYLLGAAGGVLIAYYP